MNPVHVQSGQRRAQSAQPARVRTIGFISLGCPKNQLDLELMLGQAEVSGFRITNRIEEADILVVNTCAFIGPAVEEADRNIRDAARYKRDGRCSRLIVSGCLPQYMKDKAAEKYPFVDAFMTPNDVMKLPEVLEELEHGERITVGQSVPLPSFLYDGAGPRIRSTPPGMAYVKIAEGCNHTCQFCCIPSIRGRFRSRTIASIAGEVEALVASGVREIVLISQDSTHFGKDRRADGEDLPALYARLAAIPGDFWVRTMYLYPNKVTNAVLAQVAANPERLLPYFDIPIQHVSDDILRAMRRIGDKRAIIGCLSTIRREVPGAIIRTNLVVGYPGETEAHFRELLEFVKEGFIDRLGVFPFSNHPGIPAYQENEAISEEEKQARRNLLMQAQQEVARLKNEQLVGQTSRILIYERRKVDGKGYVYLGRSYRDAHEIDGVTYVHSRERRPTGEFALVRITKAHPYDLEAAFIG
ncbi:MAG: 30S ribosomal protein S12 methylthiotransferase RimO [bacterium]|jgi:ribosomal protein S12 methylthiotransferase